MSPAEEAWNGLKRRLSQRVSEASYNIWIRPLTFHSFSNEVLYINCPNKFTAAWVRDHYLPLVRKEISASLGECLIKFISVEDSDAAKSAEGEERREGVERQLNLPTFSPNQLPVPKFCRWYTFEEFVVGESNRFAFEVCHSVAEKRRATATGEVVYLQSDSGLGKSHLAQAVGQHIYKRSPDKQLCYMSANEFTNQVVRAVKDGNLEGLKEKYRKDIDILLLEEVHALSGRTRTQAELSSTLDHLLNSGKVVILTSSRLPREIPKLDEGLRSRLDLGVITSINPPDYNTRLKIIKRKGKRYGIDIPMDVVEYMAEYLTGDIRRIEGAVVGLITRSSIQKRSIDIKLAGNILKDMVGEPEPLGLNNIISLITRHFNVSRDELRSNSRKRTVTLPRQIAMYLARIYTDETLEAIGREFKKDHATVSHAIKKIEEGFKKNTKIKHQIEYLKEQVEKERWK